MRTFNVVVVAIALLGFPLSPVLAANEPEYGEGTLFKSLFGEELEKNYGITVSSLIDMGYSRNNTSTHKERDSGLSNLPVLWYSDEGFELATSHLFIDKKLKSTMIPRITPLPGPKPEEFSFGFSAELVYGRNPQFGRTFGWDMNWGPNAANDKDLEKTTRDKKNYLAMTNMFGQVYVPYGPGFNVIAGVFGTAIGYEIPPNVRASRNQFATKTYAFASDPGTFTGVMAGTRVMNNASGILGIELGVVRGWNNMQDNNDDPSITGALRWRSSDMKAWVDYEFVAGNEQNKSFARGQFPSARIVSPDGQLKQQHSLNGWYAFTDKWSMGAELTYGRQSGDGRNTTIDIVTGPGFDGAKWYGANAVVSYQYQTNLSFSVRAERFSDPDAFILFPASTAKGTYKALTAGLRWDLNKYISIRPEVRSDWFDGNDNQRPFGNGRDTKQITSTVEALLYF